MPSDRLSAITQSISNAGRRLDVLSGRLKFDLGGEGFIFLNGNVAPCVVSNEDTDADCIVEIDSETLADMVAGRIDSRSAFIQGKMCLIGDMSLAIELAAVLNLVASEEK